MKKIFTLTAILFVGFSLNKVKAQTTGTTNLNVSIQGIQSIIVADANVDLPFTSPADYANGVTAIKSGHLTVTSSGIFSVSVKAAGDLTGPASATIPVNTVSITAAAIGSPALTGYTFASNAALTSAVSGTPVMHSATGVTTATVNVTYKAAGGNPYLNKADGTYTTILTYSITPI